MGKEVKLPLSNAFLAIKWDIKAKVGTITTLNDEKIHFFAEDLKSMIRELQRIETEINNYAKT